MTKEAQVKKITAGPIIGWIIGILFFVPGLLILFEGKIITGLFFIIAGLILLPPINKMFKEKMNFELSTGVKVIIIIVLLFIAGCSIQLGNGLFQKIDKTKTVDTKDMGIDACYKAREIIINYLKTPKTAEFQSCYDANIIITKYTNFTLYTVNSYVDSQNSFGAMLRMNFNVKFEDLGDGQLTFINWEEL